MNVWKITTAKRWSAELGTDRLSALRHDQVLVCAVGLPGSGVSVALQEFPGCELVERTSRPQALLIFRSTSDSFGDLPMALVDVYGEPLALPGMESLEIGEFYECTLEWCQ